MPKPITETNQYFANADHPLPNIPGREVDGLALFDYDGGGYFYSPFPGFHLAGMTAMSVYPVFMKSASLIMGLADRPPTPEMVGANLLHHLTQSYSPYRSTKSCAKRS